MLLCPLQGDLRTHKLAVEKLMPVLGYVTVNSVEEGLIGPWMLTTLAVPVIQLAFLLTMIML